MLRLILLFVVGIFVTAGALAIALHHYFGWKGLVAFPFIILVFAWIAKMVVKNLLKRFALGLFGMKARALRGATMNLHSVKSIPKPPEPEPTPNEDDTDEADALDEEGETSRDSDESEAAEIESPKDYIEVDVTITPQGSNSDAIWEPTELMLTSEKIRSLADLEEKEIGTTHSVEIWNGSAFGPDDPGKYPGEQRIKIIFAINPGAKCGWLHYYNEPIGEIKFPVGTINV